MKTWMKTIIVVCILLTVLNIGILYASKVIAQKGEVVVTEYKSTGYFVKVDSLIVPLDITQNPIGVFIVYTKDGNSEIWRENVRLDTYTTDEQLEKKVYEWANPYIADYERQKALQVLASTSLIVGKKIEHRVEE